MGDDVVQFAGDPGALGLVRRLHRGRRLGAPGAGRVAEHQRGGQQRERGGREPVPVTDQDGHHRRGQGQPAQPAGIAAGRACVRAQPVGADQHRRER
jgi:hypothetical protein